MHLLLVIGHVYSMYALAKPDKLEADFQGGRSMEGIFVNSRSSRLQISHVHLLRRTALIFFFCVLFTWPTYWHSMSLLFPDLFISIFLVWRPTVNDRSVFVDKFMLAAWQCIHVFQTRYAFPLPNIPHHLHAESTAKIGAPVAHQAEACHPSCRPART